MEIRYELLDFRDPARSAAACPRAVPCEDAFARQRMGPPLRANVLGQCALQWLADHAASHPRLSGRLTLLECS